MGRNHALNAGAKIAGLHVAFGLGGPVPNALNAVEKLLLNRVFGRDSVFAGVFAETVNDGSSGRT
jgi:hypothetical protein